MPNICLHLLLASRVIDHWTEEPDGAPFPIHDPRALNSFLHGAVAPDIGYLTRGNRSFSDLAHRTTSGDLARRLIADARTGVQQAYAWGWVTHVLGDLAIHPLINRAAREIAPRRAEGSGMQHPGDAAHMRVEYGLDAFCFHRHRRGAPLRLHALPDASAIDLLCSAFQQVHGVHVPAERVLQGHRVALRALRCATVLNRVLGAPLRSDPLPALARLAITLVGGVHRTVRYPRSPLLYAVLSSVPPSARLAVEVQQVLDGFAQFVAGHHATGLAGLGNYNLATGELETPSDAAGAPGQEVPGYPAPSSRQG